MKKKSVVILPLAAALAALGGTAVANAATAPTQGPAHSGVTDGTVSVEPNVLFTLGEDLMGLIVTRNADGTIVAQHRSHYSHSSHSSHRSHTSSRY